MASVQKSTTYSIELTDSEFKVLMSALDNIASDEDTFGITHTNECFELWRSLGS